MANPAALGLGGFALTTFILNIVNTGLIPAESLGMVLPMGLFYGGLAQFCAGMWEVRRGDTFGATAFSSFGAFWMGLAAMIIFEQAGIFPTVPPAGMAVFLSAWGIFTGYMTIGAFKVSKGVATIFVSLTILFFLLAIGEFVPLMRVIAGWEGIFCALSAWYVAAAVVLEATWGRPILPTGPAEG
ncbi:MAG: acetate uptake transporter [Candidatus Bipolaricaulia bacterium]